MKAGPGRPKGSQNKTTAALKEAILKSLGPDGGVSYFKWLKTENSSAYASLVGKVLPLTIGSDPNSPLVLNVITGVKRDGDNG